MKVNATDPAVKTRRLIVRLGLVVVYAGLLALVFVHGKGHTLLLDNKDSEDGSVTALEDVTVSVDGQEGTELMSGDRDMAKLRGQRHRVTIEVTGGQKIEKTFTLPLGQETMLLSVPKLVAGVEPFIIPFVPLDLAPPEEGSTSSDSFTSPGGTPENTATPTPDAAAVPPTPAP